MVVVGSGSTDPQKFTKDYCGLFTDSGVMPKRHLGRFPVTSNAVSAVREKKEKFSEKLIATSQLKLVVMGCVEGTATWHSVDCISFHSWAMGGHFWKDSGKR